jgi:hypothetical protein
MLDEVKVRERKSSALATAATMMKAGSMAATKMAS